MADLVACDGGDEARRKSRARGVVGRDRYVRSDDPPLLAVSMRRYPEAILSLDPAGERVAHRRAGTGVGLQALDEVLGADDGSGFITPLGSVYRFQGLAGVFSYTPAMGVVDNSLGLTWRAHPWRIDTTWHHFRSDAGDRRYGRELDVDVNYQLTRPHRLQLRYAHFRSASPYLNDQQILALDYSYNF
jgi:hypothetical protein